MKGLNAYLVTFWVIMCILSHVYLLPPNSAAKIWITHFAGSHLERYQSQLSSRRALLNTIIALNPDTFPWNGATQKEDRTRFHKGGLKWIDPILKPGPDRSRWEEASRIAKKDEAAPIAEERDSLSAETDKTYGKEYWYKFISEGIPMARRIRHGAKPTGRIVGGNPQ